jgi:hypothetical protein
MKLPIDTFPYLQDPRSQPIGPDFADGGYAYVRDMSGTVLGVPDGPHVHPTVLGFAKPALYAGDLTIKNGKIFDLTNLSGTFQFEEEAGLLEVAEQLRRQGMELEVGSLRFFPPDGSHPVILQ